MARRLFSRLTSAKAAILTLLTASALAVSTARYGGPPAEQHKYFTHHPFMEEKAVLQYHAVKGVA